VANISFICDDQVQANQAHITSHPSKCRQL